MYVMNINPYNCGDKVFKFSLRILELERKQAHTGLALLQIIQLHNLPFVCFSLFKELSISFIRGGTKSGL